MCHILIDFDIKAQDKGLELDIINMISAGWAN